MNLKSSHRYPPLKPLSSYNPDRIAELMDQPDTPAELDALEHLRAEIARRQAQKASLSSDGNSTNQAQSETTKPKQGI